MIDGLKELAAGEDDMSFLSQEYKDILAASEAIKLQYSEQPKMLSYLWTIVTDLYGDMSKIQGRHNVVDQIRRLREMLKGNCTHTQLSHYF